MQQSARTFLAVVLLSLLVGCSSAGTPAKVTKPTGVFATESDAAIDGSLNHPAPKALAQLSLNASVTVLSDTYGKDYWACRVRTQASQVGWVLCTSLNYERSSNT
jgi:hypothetical protein